MAGKIKNWRKSTGFIKVQTPGYPADNFEAITAKNFVSNSNQNIGSTANEFTKKITPIDKQIRIPAYAGTKYNIYWSDDTLYVGGGLGQFTGDYRGFDSEASGRHGWNQQGYEAYYADRMPRMWVELTPFNEFLDTLNTNGYNKIYNTDIKFTADGTGGQVREYIATATELKDRAINNDLYVLTKYVYYTDNLGVEQTRLYDYTIAANMTDNKPWGIFVPFSMAGKNGEDVGNLFTGVEYMSTYKARISQADNIIGGKAGNALYFYDGNRYLGINRLNAISETATPFPDTPFYFKQVDRYYDSTTAIFDPSNTTAYGFTIANKSTWETIFNGSGAKWSYKLEDVISPTDANLHKPVTPGQPDDPTDDTDGDGDNIVDDISYPEIAYYPTAGNYQYLMTHDKINDVVNYLYSETFLNDIRRLWVTPGDYVVDVSYYPCQLDETTNIQIVPGLDGSPVYIGNLNSGVKGKQISGGIPCIYAGSVDVENYYNSYLDYAPYTSMSIYIPYIGIRPLDIDLITGHTLKIAYYLDLLTHQFIAALGIDGDIHIGDGLSETMSVHGNLGKPIAQYTGSMATHIPLNGTSANDFTLNSLMQSTQVLAGAATIAGGISSANPELTLGGIGSVLGSVKPNMLKSETYGSITAMTGIYCPQKPYLIIERPIAAEPSSYRTQQGYSAAYSGILNKFSGYLECSSVTVPATGTMTEQEQQEITRMLKGGIYL